MIPSTFPRIAHLHGSAADVDDLVFSPEATTAFLAQPMLVFEKRDGLNVMLRAEGPGRIEASLKPEWQGALDGAVARALTIWIAQRTASLWSALRSGHVVYGEWLWHRVSIPYEALDDVLVVLAVRTPRGRLLGHQAMTAWADAAGLTPVRPLGGRRRRWTLSGLQGLVGPSRYGAPRMEGLIVDCEDADEEARYAKWVDAAYVHPHKGQLSGAKNHRR